jgi:Zn-finger nucleic acid-binding protein
MPLFGRTKADSDVEAEATLECPHDAHPMAKVLVDGVTVDRCTSCGGTWFDEEELRRVAHDKELERLATRVPVNAIDSPFACPRCHGRCVEGHVEEVEVDHCLDCRGVWLDRGELTEAKRQLDAQRLVRMQGAGFRSFLSRL